MLQRSGGSERFAVVVLLLLILPSSQSLSVSDALAKRYACGRFRTGTASEIRNTARVVESCLRESLRAPSGFNAQPYALKILRTEEEKEKAAAWCCGRNVDRVRDSDVSVLFLTDLHPTFGTKAVRLRGQMRAEQGMTAWQAKKVLLLSSLFSSSLATKFAWLSRFLGFSFTFFVRTAINSFNAVLCRIWYGGMPPNSLVLPTLRNSRTWGGKSTMLLAMSFLLRVTEAGMKTCPMEGYNGPGLLRSVGVESWRYELSLMVSVGSSWDERDVEIAELENAEGDDDVGMPHGDPRGVGTRATKRLTLEELSL